MTDMLERELAAKLRALGDAVPDELAPPSDLDARVQQARRRCRRGSSGLVALGLAALIAAIVGAAAVIDRGPNTTRVDITTPAQNPAPAIGSDVVMIDARGRYVVALDAGGHQVATLATARRGTIVDTQLDAATTAPSGTCRSPGATAPTAVRSCAPICGPACQRSSRTRSRSRSARTEPISRSVVAAI